MMNDTQRGDDEYATPDEIQQARELYGSDDIEIDEGAKASRAPGDGVWVAAWVWLGAAT